MTRRRVGTIAVLLLLGGAAAAAARVTRRPMSPIREQEKVHPGPDSGRVAKVLADLKVMDPLLCGLLVDQMGNYWSNGERGGYGMLGDAPPKSYAARDSLFSHTSDPKAIAVLLAHLRDDAPCARRGAAKLLGRSTIPTSRLIELMNDPSPRVQEAAAYAIGENERYDGRAALEGRITSSSEPLAAMAAWGLAEMRDSVSDVTFLRALSSRHARVRIAGARGLGDHENKEHRGALERALRDDDASVREAIVHALGDIGDPASAGALAGALADQDRRVRLRAAYALGDLDELHKAPAALLRAAESSDAELSEAAVNALAEIHDPETVDVLIGRLSSPSRDVRLRVVEALGNIGSQKAVPGLMRALKDSDAEVRRAAAEALGEIKEGQ